MSYHLNRLVKSDVKCGKHCNDKDYGLVFLILVLVLICKLGRKVRFIIIEILIKVGFMVKYDAEL